MLAGLVQGLHAAAGGESFIAFLSEIVSKQFHNIRFIIHD
jgi:hypothetical protein